MDLDPSVDGSLLLSNIIAQAPRAREAYRVHTEVSHSAIVSPSVPSRVKMAVWKEVAIADGCVRRLHAALASRAID